MVQTRVLSSVHFIAELNVLSNVADLFHHKVNDAIIGFDVLDKLNVVQQELYTRITHELDSQSSFFVHLSIKKMQSVLDS